MDIPQLPSSTIFFSEIPGDNTTNCPAVSWFARPPPHWSIVTHCYMISQQFLANWHMNAGRPETAVNHSYSLRTHCFKHQSNLAITLANPFCGIFKRNLWNRPQ
jgi:hypothetical protein